MGVTAPSSTHAHGYRSAGTVFSTGLPPVRLVSIADINADLAQDTATRYGFERADTSWEAIVKADDVDVVSVVVANSLHREIVRELAAAGKHVLCEKPLAPTPADARAMIDDVEAAGIVARVGFTFRRAPGTAAVREQLRSGRLGRPLHVSAQYWTNYGADPKAPMSWRYRGGPGTGALADLSSHLTDVAEFLAGPIEDVYGAALSTVVTERPLPLGHVVGHAHVEVGTETEPVDNGGDHRGAPAAPHDRARRTASHPAKGQRCSAHARPRPPCSPRPWGSSSRSPDAAAGAVPRHSPAPPKGSPTRSP